MKYTWRPDLGDVRDHLYTAAPVARPPVVDLQAKCLPVFDQGQLGSCTGNALAGALGFLHPDLTASRLFIYYNERSMEGTVRQDAGASIRDGVKTLVKLGACPEAKWPYDIARFRRRPLKACYTAALPHRVASYTRIQSLDDMLNCLASGFPFVFGFTVYSAFESGEMARTGVLNLPAQGEKVLGGHAVMAVGYDLAAKRIKVRNSWGTGWGIDGSGYFSMPFDYLTHRGLSDDFWTLRK